MSTPHPDQREQLREILERFGSTLETFDQLRVDSYEHVLASFSLEQLEHFYALLFAPGQTIEAILDQFPAWPTGKRQGKQPSLRTLYEVQNRFRSEQTLGSLENVSAFVAKIQKKATALAIGQQGGVMDTLCALVGEELIQAKMGGKALDLDSFDRLLNAKSAKDKGEIEKAKLELRQQAEARALEKLKLEKDKWIQMSCEKILEAARDKRAQQIAESNVPNAEKIKQLRQTYFADVDALEKSGSVQIPA